VSGRVPPEAVARARGLLGHLDTLGYDFYTGVPCSLLNGLYAALEERRTAYWSATREDLALGLAAGAALAGRRPAVLMQNSGLGVSVNALVSLQRMYALPVLLIVTWRGHGPDAPEHVDMGRRMLPFLDTLEIPWRFALEADAREDGFHAHPGPVALIVRPGDLS
jgi:sulfopyruvate decarboxylase subunit alpha